MLSAYSYFLISKHVTSEILSPNLYDKTKFVVHYENLRFYLKHGLQLIKVHRILKFKQSTWIKPYIDFNTEKRRAAKWSFLRRTTKTSTIWCLKKPLNVSVKEWTSNWLLTRLV